VAHQITDDFTLEGIALGTIVLLAGYHLLRWLAPAHMRESLDRHTYEEGTGVAVGHTGVHRDPYEDEASLGEVGFERGAAGTPPPPRRDDDDAARGPGH
jgi:hypothetical protein